MAKCNQLTPLPFKGLKRLTFKQVITPRCELGQQPVEERQSRRQVRDNRREWH